MADYESWAGNVVPGGVLVFHDVFEDPAEGGQAPFEVWKRAVADGFAPESDDRLPPSAAAGSSAVASTVRVLASVRRDHGRPICGRPITDEKCHGGYDNARSNQSG